MATKSTLVKDIFFAATSGMRNIGNFADGQMLIEEIARNNYKWAIEAWMEDYQSDKKSAEKVLSEMVDQTVRNCYDKNCRPTIKSKEIEMAYHYNFYRR